MRNIKLVIQYDGTKYAGWQRLPNQSTPTIQGKIEDVLSKMTHEEVQLIGSGRTDRGVHALAQVANFHTNCQKPCETIRTYLNTYLPEDISVTFVSEVNEQFHSRFNVVEKTYQYRLWRKSYPPVFQRLYVSEYTEKLDLNFMKSMVAHLLGTHDFQSFSNKKTKKSTIRTITAIEFIETPEELIIEMTGDGFLYNMARILVGTLLDLGEHKLTEEGLIEMMSKKERNGEIERVPAKGLSMKSVFYK